MESYRQIRRVEIHGTRTASLKDYYLDLQKILVFSMSPLWRVWWLPGPSESFCIATPDITDTQGNCQTRTSTGDTSICVGDDTMSWVQNFKKKTCSRFGTPARSEFPVRCLVLLLSILHWILVSRALKSLYLRR